MNEVHTEGHRKERRESEDFAGEIEERKRGERRGSKDSKRGHEERREEGKRGGERTGKDNYGDKW